jgi:hypothetical protein
MTGAWRCMKCSNGIPIVACPECLAKAAAQQHEPGDPMRVPLNLLSFCSMKCMRAATRTTQHTRCYQYAPRSKKKRRC